MATNSISYTATTVRPLPGYLSVRIDAGGSLYAGQAVYIGSDGDVVAADADGSLSAMVLGIVIADNDGGTLFVDGNVVDVVYHGRVTGYASMTPGLAVYASTLAGQMQQAETFVSGDYISEVGIAVTATEILVNPVRHLGPAEDGTHA